jgi:uncharacterized protein (DUF1778 family)
MAKPHSQSRSSKAKSSRSLVFRLDEESKTFLTQAAELRRISVSDYVREVTMAQARRERRRSRSSP